MKRIIHTAILLMATIIVFAQSFKVRECTEAELPRSKRDRYFVQVEQFLNNYYMHLLNLEDNIIQESFIGLVYSDKNAATLVPEFDRGGISSVRMKPGQYLLELEKSLAEFDKDGLEFKVDNIRQGKIMMNSLVSCYIPVEYDLTLMDDDKILFKRRCRMYGLFDDIRNYMDVKLMQVEPVEDLAPFANHAGKPESEMSASGNSQNEKVAKKEKRENLLKQMFQPPQKKEKRKTIYLAINDDLGATLSIVSKSTRKRLKLTDGVKIASVREGRLKESGCSHEFIVLKANNMNVKDIWMFQDIITQAKESVDKTLHLEGIYSTGDKAAYTVYLK